MKRTSLALAILATVPVLAFATPTLDELAQKIDQQQKQIDSLNAELEKGAGGLGGDTSVGGYGEAQFYHFENKDDIYDAYRFVMYLGHRFSDNVRFHSELEVEHGLVADTDTDAASCTLTSGTTTVTCPAKTSTKPGEVELEQMYLAWNYLPEHRLSVGQMLVPVGILNETHEPDSFYGVKRNMVETNIIPATWWEGGLMLSGNIVDGLSYDVMYSTGLNKSSGDVRSGRQKGAKATAEDFATTVRVKYTGVPGLELGAAVQKQADIAQGSIARTDVSATLKEVHVVWQAGPVTVKALRAEWDIDNLASGDLERKEQKGWYLEPAVKLLDGKLGLFTRYSKLDNKAAANSTNVNADSEITYVNYGANWYLTPRTVFKLDFQEQDDPANSGKEEDGFALGMGYSF